MKPCKFLSAGRLAGIIGSLAIITIALTLGAQTTGCGTGEIRFGGGGGGGGGPTEYTATLSIPNDAAGISVSEGITIDFGKSLSDSEKAAIEAALRLGKSSDSSACATGNAAIASVSAQAAGASEDVPFVASWNNDNSEVTILPDHRLSYRTRYVYSMQEVTLDDGSIIGAIDDISFCTDNNPLSLDQQDGRYPGKIFDRSDGTAGMLFGNQICPAPVDPWRLSDLPLPWTYDPGVPGTRVLSQSAVNLLDGYSGFALSDGAFQLWKGVHSGPPDTVFSHAGIMLAGAYRIADVNGDGIMDLIIREVTMIQCAGGREPWANFCGDGSEPSYDITNLHLFYMRDFGPSVDVLNADLNFDSRTNHQVRLIRTSALPPFIESGDINGDGHDDLVKNTYVPIPVAAPYDTLYVFFSTASGAMPAGPDVTIVMEPHYGISGLKIKDVNGDGYADILTSLMDTTSTLPGEIAVFLGREGPFPNLLSLADMIIVGDSAAYAFARPAMFEVGDFDGDRKYDIIASELAGTNGVVYLFYGRQTSADQIAPLGAVNARRVSAADAHDVAFIADVEAGKSSFGIRLMEIGDMNNDGFDDFSVFSYPTAGDFSYFDFFLGGERPSQTLFDSSTACSTMIQ